MVPIGRHAFKISTLVRIAGAIGTRIVHIGAPVARVPWPSGPLTVRSKRNTPRAGSRPRQQCRPSPQGAEEEDAARGRIPRDETPRPLRKTLREEGPGEDGSHPPRPQARPQKAATRGFAADEASGNPRRSCKSRPAARASPLILDKLVDQPKSTSSR